LSWVEDKHVFCILLLGVPGASKSHFIYCLGGQFGKPVINFDIAGMQDSLVGNSGKNLRKGEATVEAISDGQIILIATANSLRGLPAELLSRFEKGGIFFFDVPDESERAEILALKIKKFNLTPEQTNGFAVSETEGWTGREIESLCDKADRLGCTLAEAAAYVVPLTVSQKASIDELRESANNRYLSASKPGLYSFTKTTTVIDHNMTSTAAGPRKLR
jgi:SpoVK/Ycf46/Vps4 family AAA+-type ATPase